MSPDWPKRCTPEARDRRAADAAQERERVRVAVEQRDERAAAAANSRSRIAGSPSPQPRAGLERAEQQVGAGDADDLGVEPASSRARRRPRAPRARARPSPRSPPAAPSGGAQPVAAGEHAPSRVASPASAWSIGRVESRKYADVAVRAAEPRQRVQEASTRGPARTPAPRPRSRAARSRSTGVIDRLVRAALGPERDPARRADEDRLAAGVDAERPRLERAGDERVVDRADRQQRLAVARPRRAELAEQPDEVDLGDPELDVAAVVGLAPAHERVGVVGEPVDAVAERPDAGLVDPAAEVGRRADVGRDRDDARGHLGRLAHEVDEEAPERLLGRRACRVCSRPRSAGHRAAARRRDRRPALEPPRRAPRTARPRAMPSANAPTGPPGRSPSARGELARTARSVSSAEWLAGWPSVGSRQPLIV